MEYMDVYTGEVVKAAFATQRFVPLGPTQEKEDHSSITETAYVPPQIQIRDMMLAGLRLAEERRARFDSVELGVEDGDIPLDPTREPGVDIVDLERAAAAVSAAVNVAVESAAAKEKEVADAARKAEINAAVEKALQEKAVK